MEHRRKKASNGKKGSYVDGAVDQTKQIHKSNAIVCTQYYVSCEKSGGFLYLAKPDRRAGLQAGKQDRVSRIYLKLFVGVELAYRTIELSSPKLCTCIQALN